MTASELGILIQICVTLAMIWALVCFCWRRYAVDKLRQDLFALRDRLFDLAHEHPESEIAFGRPAYEEFRSDLNGVIRFAHRISFFRAIVFQMSRRSLLPQIPTGRSVRRSWAIIVAIEDEKLRAAVSAMVRETNWIILKFFMKTSALFLAMASIVILRAIIRVWRTRQLATLPTGNRMLPRANPISAFANRRRVAEIAVKKVTAHRMRRTHEAVWLESREHAEAGGLTACPS